MTSPSPFSADAPAALRQLAEKLRTLGQVTGTRFPVAQTPRQVIWTLNKARLYRYTPVVPAAQRHRVPLLLVFALINRPYILDLRPGNSFVEHMVQQGYDVYLLDWGAPGLEDRHMDFGDYALEYLPRAIRKMQRVAGTRDFSLLGWCIGAIITSCYAALRPAAGLRNLVLLTAPLDFSNRQAGGFVSWVNDERFDVGKILDAYGNMPGPLIDYGARALKPVENAITTYLRLWDNLDNPRIVESWHAMNTWVTDLIPMAGATYRQLINELYRENRLFAGTFRLRGETVDLAQLRANLLNVVAESDHITPTCQSETAMEQFGSPDKQLVRVRGGHIGLMAGSSASKGTWPHIERWLAERSA